MTYTFIFKGGNLIGLAPALGRDTFTADERAELKAASLSISAPKYPRTNEAAWPTVQGDLKTALKKLGL